MKHKVLVVDDEPHIPRILKMSLEPEGWAVVVARNGQEALDAMGAELPGVMITDLSMPIMDGKALCHEVVARYPERPFPIIVMTSLVEREVRQWVNALGNITFLEKPVSPRKVLTALQRLEGQEQSSANADNG